MIIHRKGFTLVELVIIIAILTLLASIAVTYSIKASKLAKGSQIIANMNLCETAINLYFSQNGRFPENNSDIEGVYIAVWPKPPTGSAGLKKLNGSDLDLEVGASSYVYTKPEDKAELNTRVGRITLGGMTIEEILSTSEDSLTLTDAD